MIIMMKKFKTAVPSTKRKINLKSLWLTVIKNFNFEGGVAVLDIDCLVVQSQGLTGL